MYTYIFGVLKWEPHGCALLYFSPRVAEYIATDIIIMTKYCGIVRKVLSLVRFGSTAQHYSTKVLCHYGYNR